MSEPLGEKVVATKTIPVVACARCGGDHDAILFLEFERPIVVEDVAASLGVRAAIDLTFTFWGICPTTLSPILLVVKPEGGTE